MGTPQPAKARCRVPRAMRRSAVALLLATTALTALPATARDLVYTNNTRLWHTIGFSGSPTTGNWLVEGTSDLVPLDEGDSIKFSGFIGGVDAQLGGTFSGLTENNWRSEIGVASLWVENITFENTNELRVTGSRFSIAGTVFHTGAPVIIHMNDTIFLEPGLGANDDDNVVFDTDGLLAIYNPLHNNFSRGVEKEGTGTLFLNGNNTYGGRTQINEGTISIFKDGNLGVGDVIGDGGTLQVTANTTLNNNMGGSDLTYEITASQVTNTGGMVGSGTFTKSGAGTLFQDGVLNHTGGTNVTDGTLWGDLASLRGNFYLADGAELVLSEIGLANVARDISGEGFVTLVGGDFRMTGNFSYTGGTNVLFARVEGDTNTIQGDYFNDGEVEFDQAAGGTYAGDMAGLGRLVKSGAGLVTLTGQLSHTGGTTINEGQLMSVDGALQGHVINNGLLNLNQTVDGQFGGDVSGSGSLRKTGAGQLQLLGSTSHTGGTVVSGGVLVGNTANLQGDIANGAEVWFLQSTDGTYSGAMAGAGVMRKLGSGTLTLTGANEYTGGTMLVGGELKGTTATLKGNFSTEAGTELIVDGAGTFGGNVSGSGALRRSGVGLLVMNGANSYTGGTIIEGGVVQGTTNSLQGAIENQGAGEVRFVQSFDGTYAGELSGSGGLRKSGAGKVNMSGANTYTGATTINSGTLSLSGVGSIDASSQVVVDDAGTLDASGRTGGYAYANNVANSGVVVGGIGANVFELSGNVTGDGDFLGNMMFSGSYGPGNSPGLATHGNTTFGAGNLLTMEIGGLARGAEYDAIDAITLMLGGTLKIDLLDLDGGSNLFAPQAGAVFDLLLANSIAGMFATFDFTGAVLADGLSWSWGVFDLGDFDVFRLSVLGPIVDPGDGVPAPGAMVLLAFGVLVLVARRRRR
ncbi:MAG: autotransporter-associated beta strand repeat-containing protein [Rhodospirillaceae bacterium]|nr:autotransporter-associated beta strand repeat-containing protein [Rhodospirillaceae bacterium]